MTAGRWFISLHALERMREMGVERPEVVACLDEPEVDRQGRPSSPDDLATYPRRVARRGRLSVVYVPESRLVVTVLWSYAGVTGRE